MFLAFAVFMILSFVVSMVALPSTNAQTTRDQKTFPYVEANPTKCGVQQPVLINVGISHSTGNVADGWNMTLTVVDPDGGVETIPVMTWSTGMAGIYYTPSRAGDYVLTASFPETIYRNVRYLASKTDDVILRVDADYWKDTYPGHALPSEYWTRPVDSQLREWWSIMGSWLIQKPRNNNVFAPYNLAPESAHILWSMPDDQYMGGISGNIPDMAYEHGDAYEGKFEDAIIVSGVLFYNVAAIYGGAGTGNAMDQRVKAIDLHTGKELWVKSIINDYDFPANTRLVNGQVVSVFTENNRGAWSYLWLQNGQTWYAINPLTGNHIYTMTNVPSGTLYFGPNGEMLKYSVTNLGNTTNPNWVLRQWNSTRVGLSNSGMIEVWGTSVSKNTGPVVLNATGDTTANSPIGPSGVSRGYDWEIPLPRNLGTPLQVFPGDRAIFANVTVAGVTLSAVSLSKNDFGRMLYSDKFWQAPSDWQYITIDIGTPGGGQTGWAAFSNDPYIGLFWVKELTTNYAFDLTTGNLLWYSAPQHFMDALGGATSNSAPERAIAYGCVIEGSVGGIVYCYNATTGELRWKYEATDLYVGESYISERWWLALCFISDGKVYFGHHEHSASVPLPRGAPFFALDIESGEVVWRINGAFRQGAWGGRAIIGDSIIATLDTYDSQIYAIGKGPSAMTVLAPNVAIKAGTPFVISGTIMDVSPGTESDGLRMRFPNGVPAMSDDSMSDWMLYVYKNFEKPSNAIGVPITVQVVDQNGEVVYLNTVSNANGNYAVEFTPESEGIYEICAYFDGSASYYSSSAEAVLSVKGITETTNNDTPYELYIIGMGIVIIITVVLIGLWIKKK